jgi:AAA+ superfamily predicted ATPase
VARSDLLKRLFGAYSRGDDIAFRSVAAEIIDDERRKHHALLATELRHALARDDRMPGAATPLAMRPLPKDRDDRPLIRLTKPAREFDDLILAEDVEALLLELVQDSRSRSVLSGFGLRPRQRLLFVGSSGTGKSTAAHAVAAELSLPVATVSLAALTSSYLGETARNVERIVRFAEATPCVLLFDEFDVIGAERGSSNDHAELRRVVATVLQLLEQMHGESVFIATSNHPALLDAAVWRRFDEVVAFYRLDTIHLTRLINLKIHAAPHRISGARWAERLRGESPATVEAVCLDSLRRWVLSGSPKLTDEHVAASVGLMKRRRKVISAVAAQQD